MGAGLLLLFGLTFGVGKLLLGDVAWAIPNLVAAGIGWLLLVRTRDSEAIPDGAADVSSPD